MLASHNKVNYKFNLFNIACGKEITLNYLLDKIIYHLKIEKKNLKVKYLSFRKGDIKRSKANINKAKKILKYKPSINFDKGLENYIQFIKNTK